MNLLFHVIIKCIHIMNDDVQTFPTVLDFNRNRKSAMIQVTEKLKGKLKTVSRCKLTIWCAMFVKYQISSNKIPGFKRLTRPVSIPNPRIPRNNTSKNHARSGFLEEIRVQYLYNNELQFTQALVNYHADMNS